MISQWATVQLSGVDPSLLTTYTDICNAGIVNEINTPHWDRRKHIGNISPKNLNFTAKDTLSILYREDKVSETYDHIHYHIKDLDVTTYNKATTLKMLQHHTPTTHISHNDPTCNKFNLHVRPFPIGNKTTMHSKFGMQVVRKWAPS